ncbi:MAG: hypothetical protein LBE56_11340, partial [Tannerella sp.]|nr:hypothetical protein [Tannerella sp.]
MKTFRRNVCSHIRQISSIFLMFGMLLLWLYSCETEYIPNKPDPGVTTYSATEGNFNITVHFANYGDEDELPDTHSMTPETDIIPLGNNQMIYATLAVDNVDGEHPV